MKKKGKLYRIPGRNPFGAQAKMWWHLDRLNEFLDKGSTFPIEIEINPTNFCNMHCEWCISSYSQKKEFIDRDALLDFLEQYKDMGGKTVIWSGGGEPTTHPSFQDFVLRASELQIKQGLMTNGLFPTEMVNILGNNMEWIRISLDTFNEEKFRRLKHTDGFHQVIKNIEKLSQQPSRVVININLAQWNIDEIIDKSVIINSKRLGADALQIRPVLWRPYDTNPAIRIETRDFILRHWNVLREIEELDDKNFRIYISWDKFYDLIDLDNNFGRTYDKCQYHNFICVLNANGDLCVCMYRLGDDRFTFGNIYEKSLKEIWEGHKRKEVIKFCNEKIDFNECQVCCKGHELNKLLYFIQNRDERSDPDFL